MDLAKKLRELGYVPVVDGIITGFAGGVLAEAPLKTKDVAAILAPTSMLFPDPDSAVSVLKLLDSVLPNVGIGKVAAELEKDVASLKKMMKGLMQKLQSNIQSGGGGLRRSQGVPQGMYQWERESFDRGVCLMLKISTNQLILNKCTPQRRV